GVGSSAQRKDAVALCLIPGCATSFQRDFKLQNSKPQEPQHGPRDSSPQIGSWRNEALSRLRGRRYSRCPKRRFLAWRTSSEIVNGIADGDSPHDKVIDLLVRIANGEETLVPSGAELRSVFPDIRDLEATRSGSQKSAQLTARLVLIALRNEKT